MNWQGMNAENGHAISETAHILQSVRDILTTPIGTRVMRRTSAPASCDALTAVRYSASSISRSTEPPVCG